MSVKGIFKCSKRYGNLSYSIHICIPEVADFPLIPPLPDDEPPAPPPPPPPQPQDTRQQEDQSKQSIETTKPIESNDKNQINVEKTSETDVDKTESAPANNDCDKSNDLEVIEVVRVNDIPIPEDDLIVIDDDVSTLWMVTILNTYIYIGVSLELK